MGLFGVDRAPQRRENALPTRSLSRSELSLACWGEWEAQSDATPVGDLLYEGVTLDLPAIRRSHAPGAGIASMYHLSRLHRLRPCWVTGEGRPKEGRR